VVSYLTECNEYIVRVFPPFDRGMTLVFKRYRRYRIQGEIPSVGALKYTKVGKICDFQPKSAFVSEMVQERPMIRLLRITNRKS